MMNRALFPLSFILFLYSLSTARAQQTFPRFHFENQRVPTDVAASDFFGGTTAAFGEFAVATTFLQDTGGVSNAGAAYVYKRNTVTLEMDEIQKLTAVIPLAEERFGFKADICQDFIVVSALGSNSLYVFRKNNANTVFQFIQTLSLTTSADSVACAGDYIAAGTGSLVQFYTYSRGSDTFALDGSVTETTSVEASSFGASIAMHIRQSVPYVVVGAPSYDNANGGSTVFDQGAAFVYARTGAATWSLEDTLFAGDAASADAFGSAVAMHGDKVLVSRTTDGGAAYVFLRDANNLGGWTQDVRLNEPGSFARCIALNDDFIVVGDNRDAGRLRVFNNDGTYNLHTTYVMANYLSSNDDNIGDACAVTSYNHIVGGGTRSSVSGVSSGSVVFLREVPDAIGGFRDPNDGQFACDAEWQYRAEEGGILIDADADGCLDRFDPSTAPFNANDTAFNEASAIGAIDTNLYTIDTTRWCSFRQRRCRGTSVIYRKDILSTDPSCTSGEIRRSWGYCVQKKFQVVTREPTTSPTTSPTIAPTSSPTKRPSGSPSTSPTKRPSTSPTTSPSASPSLSPTKQPTRSPSKSPTANPSTAPTRQPTRSPSTSPSFSPSSSPSRSPTRSPVTPQPTQSPRKTDAPTTSPTDHPSSSPSTSPSNQPSTSPTKSPSVSPTSQPTQSPVTRSPSRSPSSSPSRSPTKSPSRSPTAAPSEPIQCGCPAFPVQ